jgi:HEAT repeat protein
LLLSPDSRKRSNLLTDQNLYVRFSAADALGRLGSDKPAVVVTTPEIVKALLNLLTDQNSYVRSSAADALVRLESATPGVVTVLLDLLADQNSYVRTKAVDALVRLSKKLDEILPKVVQWLEQNPNNEGVGNAIDCLWSIVVE